MEPQAIRSAVERYCETVGVTGFVHMQCCVQSAIHAGNVEAGKECADRIASKLADIRKRFPIREAACNAN